MQSVGEANEMQSVGKQTKCKVLEKEAKIGDERGPTGMSHRWAQGVGLTPPGPPQPPSWRWTPPQPTKTQGAKNCNRKNTLDSNLHYPFLTLGEPP